MVTRVTLRFLTATTLWFALAASHSSLAHVDINPVDVQVNDWLVSLGTQRDSVQHAFDSPERFNFRWVPATRKGIRLDQLNAEQRHALSHIFKTVLSEEGERKLDAIIATEAALAVMTKAPEYRNPGKYYTSVFGRPGQGHWGMRFEGHHLSVNLTFDGARLISGTPLFLGANPETIEVGPDKGLRALKAEVDEARKLFDLLSAEQKAKAAGSEEWFPGFLTDAGSRRASLGKPAGIPASELNDAQQAQLRKLIAVYVTTLHETFAQDYLQKILETDWPQMHFFWRGDAAAGKNFYYRIAGKRLFIEQDAHAGATHIHAIWRDVENDFGGL